MAGAARKSASWFHAADLRDDVIAVTTGGRMESIIKRRKKNKQLEWVQKKLSHRQTSGISYKWGMQSGPKAKRQEKSPDASIHFFGPVLPGEERKPTTGVNKQQMAPRGGNQNEFYEPVAEASLKGDTGRYRDHLPAGIVDAENANKEHQSAYKSGRKFRGEESRRISNHGQRAEASSRRRSRWPPR